MSSFFLFKFNFPWYPFLSFHKVRILGYISLHITQLAVVIDSVMANEMLLEVSVHLKTLSLKIASRFPLPLSQPSAFLLFGLAWGAGGRGGREWILWDHENKGYPQGSSGRRAGRSWVSEDIAGQWHQASLQLPRSGVYVRKIRPCYFSLCNAEPALILADRDC